jgi:hypothetical protein
MKSQNPFYLSTFEARWKAKIPMGKVRPSFSRTNLFKFARRAWSLCVGTRRVIKSCNPWSTEAKSRLCSRTSKHLTWGSLLMVLATKIRQSKPRVREEYTTSFMHIFGTNKVPRVVLQFSWTSTHLGGKGTNMPHEPGTAAPLGMAGPAVAADPARCGRTCPVPCLQLKSSPSPHVQLGWARLIKETLVWSHVWSCDHLNQ